MVYNAVTIMFMIGLSKTASFSWKWNLIWILFCSLISHFFFYLFYLFFFFIFIPHKAYLFFAEAFVWDYYFRVLADDHIPWACEAFSRLHGHNLIQAPALIW